MNTLLAVLLAPLASDLAADSHGVRETRTRQLAALGPLARPALLAACDGPDPEARRRAGRLLDRDDARRADALAALVLLGWVDLDDRRLADDATRRRLYRVAVALGCPDALDAAPEGQPDAYESPWLVARDLSPDNDPAGSFWWTPPDPLPAVRAAVAACRAYLRESAATQLRRDS